MAGGRAPLPGGRHDDGDLYAIPAYQPGVVRLRPAAWRLLLFLLLAVLAGGGFWVLSTFGKKVVTAPVESIIQPSWIKEAVAYAPEATAATKAAAGPRIAAPRSCAQLAAMQQEMQTQREALEALKTAARDAAPAGTEGRTAPAAPAPKAHGSMLFVSHELKEANRRTQGERVHAGAWGDEAALHPRNEDHF